MSKGKILYKMLSNSFLFPYAILIYYLSLTNNSYLGFPNWFLKNCSSAFCYAFLSYYLNILNVLGLLICTINSKSLSNYLPKAEGSPIFGVR